MRWAVFYADGAVYDSMDGSHEGAPSVGVVAVVQHLDGGRVEVLHQADLYWWRDGMWWAGDIHGLVDQSARFGASWVKQGQTVRAEEYSEIVGAAINLKAEWDGAE